MNKEKHTGQKRVGTTFADYGEFHIPAWLRGIIFAVTISVYGYRGSFFEALGEEEFLFVTGLYFLVAIALMLGMDWKTASLDRRQPWNRGWVSRLFYQAASCVAVPLFIMVELHKVMSKLLPPAIQQSSFLHTDVYLILLFLILINAWYAIAFLLHRNKRLARVNIALSGKLRLVTNATQEMQRLHAECLRALESERTLLRTSGEEARTEMQLVEEERDHYKTELLESRQLLRIADVKIDELQEVYKAIKEDLKERSVAEQKLRVHHLHVVNTEDRVMGYKDEDVAYFRAKEDNIYIGLLSGSEFWYQSGSLDSLEGTLGCDDYMRVNRNYLIPLHAVEGATQASNKEITISLKDNLGTKIIAYKHGGKSKLVTAWLLHKVKLHKVG
ncbi:hypothetical protein GCM10011418_39660 [Sphingobacterium alkalisoli]|nr:LytTR family transcriptional regulator DNA-binding domain-containing protein [Sphingobacterium alkalisoli]GGH28786.1 hypothetical protein GCM10011418_39660 [Sphingobacterium alkalisoli]